ncbi:MAG: hypothetical protein LBE56_10430 [Tannerella sp.]|nr:hypothetical protein [Tannerella sp.]
MRTFAGRSLTSCPFRYQGQYQDAETGLYYNRFRYYDHCSGNYILKILLTQHMKQKMLRQKPGHKMHIHIKLESLIYGI